MKDLLTVGLSSLRQRAFTSFSNNRKMSISSCDFMSKNVLKDLLFLSSSGSALRQYVKTPGIQTKLLPHNEQVLFILVIFA
jgi:hypothetical protein